MKQIQKTVDDWLQQFEVPYWKPADMMLRLSEEVGELAREINHRFGPKTKKTTEDTKEIEDELGDLIFTITCIANSLEIDLDKAFNNTMKKYKTRDSKRHKKK